MAKENNLVAGTHGGASHEEALCDTNSSILATWMFIGAEIMLFAALFALYVFWRVDNYEAFKADSQYLNKFFGGLGSIALILSSGAVALGTSALSKGKNSLFRTFYFAAIFIAAIFILLKYLEYTANFNYTGAENYPNGIKIGASHFFSLYFMMTGLHALHVILAMAFLLYCVYLNKIGKVHQGRFNTVEVAGLYWHLVSLIWIFIFPFLYLI